MPRKRMRAPNGYNIKMWKDGMFHVYLRGSGVCLDEFATNLGAIEFCYEHQARNKRKKGAESGSPKGEGFNPIYRQ